MDIISNAIESSKARNEIAHIEAIDMSRAGTDYETVAAHLMRECEGEVANTAAGVHEFWGSEGGDPEMDDEPRTWRVHVALSDDAE